MYSAYFDESGHPDDSDYLIVAGAVASVGQWVAFESDWKAILAPFNTDLFHANEFAQRKKPFDKITKGQARDIHLQLATIICNRTEKLVSFTLDMNKYKRVNSQWLLGRPTGRPERIPSSLARFGPAFTCSEIRSALAWQSRPQLPASIRPPVRLYGNVPGGWATTSAPA